MHAFTRFLMVAAAALATGAGLLLSAGPAAAASHHVTISSYSYHPAALSITAGDTVTWTNLDSVAHDVTVTRGPALFHSPMLSQGQSWSYTFTVAGPYDYICSVHPDMKATVTVQPQPVQPVAAAPAHQTSHGTAVAHKSTPAPAVATPSPALAMPATTMSSGSSSGGTQINPLLLVSGALCAVVVFCLLLMASRPQPEVVPITGADERGAMAASPPPPPTLDSL